MRVGNMYVVGRHADGGFAVWDQTSPLPEARYGPTDWATASADLDTVEAAAVRPPASDSSSSSSGIVGLLIFVLIVGAIYVWYHAHRYSGCVISPGLFAWPSMCL